MKMIIPVDFVGSTTIEESIKEAKDLAIKLNVGYVTYSFNGVEIYVKQTTDIDELSRQYHLKGREETFLIG